LLQHATFGASLAEIDRVRALGGATAYVDEQLAIPRVSTTEYTDYAQQLLNENAQQQHGCTSPTQPTCPWLVHAPMFYKRAMEGDDQLRQRVVNALSQILVVSIANNRIQDSGVGMASYLDMLGNNVFAAPIGVRGSYHKILKEMTLHPAMGIYQDVLGSTQEVPNENYAREILQLFSVGTVMLNLDGTPVDGNAQLAGIQTVPVYDEDTVKGFARAFTGWSFANQDYDTPIYFYAPTARWTTPMTPWPARRCPQSLMWTPTVVCDINDPNKSFPRPHSLDSKKLLQYTGAPFATIPARTYTAGFTEAQLRTQAIQFAQEDIDRAIDNIFNHPNVGPFVAKQLIQRLTTSNPSNGYVSRVATVFNNNGSGVRGDMRAVIRAVLLDIEARDSVFASSDVTFGKLREPVLKFTQLHRAFNARPQSGYYDVWQTDDPDWLGQSALKAPSVFNFYAPSFSPAGAMGNSQLLGPEFEIASTSTVAGFAFFSGWGVIRGFKYYDSTPFGQHPNHWRPDRSRYLSGVSPLADDPQALVDELDLLLTANNLKADFRARLVTMIGAITDADIAQRRLERLDNAMWQIMHSQDYAIQR
jgi:uncharacterized protein (DUF1800 family)